MPGKKDDMIAEILDLHARNVQKGDHVIQWSYYDNVAMAAHTIVSAVATILLIYWTCYTWVSSPSIAYDSAYRDRKWVLALAVINVVLCTIPVVQSIRHRDIMGTMSILSCYFFACSLVILLWAWRLWKDPKQRWLQETKSMLFFVLFSLVLQLVGYMATTSSILLASIDYRQRLRHGKHETIQFIRKELAQQPAKHRNKMRLALVQKHPWLKPQLGLKE
jgi:hypothetical protein